MVPIDKISQILATLQLRVVCVDVSDLADDPDKMIMWHNYVYFAWENMCGFPVVASLSANTTCTQSHT